MACCGQKRAQAVSQRRNVAEPPRPVPAPANPGARVEGTLTTASSVTLRYLRYDPLAVRGPRTGRVYSVSGTNAVVVVDPHDVAALLRTGLFVSEGD